MIPFLVVYQIDDYPKRLDLLPTKATPSINQNFLEEYYILIQNEKNYLLTFLLSFSRLQTHKKIYQK